jgi:hypothetical protein
MNAIHSVGYLLCAGAITLCATAPLAHAQAAQSQTLNESRARQLQSQPPKLNTDQEWKSAVEFMQKYCPNRLAFVSQLQDRPIQFERAKERILKQYRQISNTKDAQVRDLALKQAQIQDQIFGALDQIRNTRDPRKKLEAQTVLKEAENQQVNVQIALRLLRISRLQSEVEEFQKKRQAYVDNWTKDELKRAATGNLDEGSKLSGNADIADGDASPPTKK